MRWFLDMSVRAKLLVGFGLVIAMLVATAGTAAIALGSMRDAQREVIEKGYQLALRGAQNRQRALFLDMSLKTRRPEQEALERDIRAGRPVMDQQIERIK